MYVRTLSEDNYPIVLNYTFFAINMYDHVIIIPKHLNGKVCNRRKCVICDNVIFFCTTTQVTSTSANCIIKLRNISPLNRVSHPEPIKYQNKPRI